MLLLSLILFHSIDRLFVLTVTLPQPILLQTGWHNPTRVSFTCASKYARRLCTLLAFSDCESLSLILNYSVFHNVILCNLPRHSFSKIQFWQDSLWWDLCGTGLAVASSVPFSPILAPTFCLLTHPNSKHVANSNHHSSWQSFGHWFHLTNCVCQCVGGFGGTQWTSCSSSHFVKTGKMVSRATFLRSLVQGCRALLGHNTNRGHSVKCIDFEAILEFFCRNIA